MSDKKLFEDFGLDDLAEEHSDNRAGKIVLAVFLFAMWAALAWTTAEFFAAFGSQLGQRFGQLAPLFAAAFGVLTIDVAYSAWLYAGKEQADTTAQRIAAIGTAVVLFLISLIVTGVYMMLTGDLREGVIDAQMTDTLKVAGIAILAASTVVNGVGLMLWAVLGHGWRKAAFYSKMRAVLYEEAASIDEQRAKLTAAARREWLKAQMPDAASQRGIQAGGQYMERAQLAAASRPAPAETPESPPVYQQSHTDGHQWQTGLSGEGAERVLREYELEMRRKRDGHARPTASPKLAEFLKQIGMKPDELRNLARQYGLTDAATAYRIMHQFGYLPDGVTRAEFDVLFAELMNGGEPARPTQPARNGNGRHVE